MKFLLVSCLVWVAATGSAVGAPAPADDLDPVHPGLTRDQFVRAKTLEFPTTKNGELGDAAVGSDRYDMLRCDLDLTIDPDTTLIDGSVKMVFAAREPGLTEMVFDLRHTLAVTGIEHASGPLFHAHEADSVTVSLPAALGAGEVDSFIVVYGGQPTQPLVNRGLMFRVHESDPVNFPDVWTKIVANMSEPGYAQSWWPCKDKPGDKFLMTMDLTVPDDMVGVSNGELVSTEAAGTGWTTYRWRHGFPIASYLVSVAITDYRLLQADCTTTGGTDVPLRNWVFPEDEADAAIDFAPLCEMVDFCESVFGPYPYAGERYGHAEIVWPGAMEHPTVTSIGNGSLRGDGSRDWLIVHELGHQWFGDSLTPAEWADIWLNEGFATYTEALWYEHLGGETYYREYLANHRNEGEWRSQGPVYDPIPVFPGRVIYDKGAWILHVLRERMGDTAFFGLLDAWANTGGRPGGTVATQEFIDLAGAWAHESLDDFLWPYLTEAELPAISFSHTLEDGPGGAASRVQVTVTQVGTRVFELDVPVVLTTAGGVETFPVRVDRARFSLALDAAESVLNVAYDPERTALWRAPQAGEVQRGLTLVFPNPSRGDKVVFRYWLDAPGTARLRVYDVRGRRVASRRLEDATAGLKEVDWDVTDDGGARVPSGVYWGTLEIDGRRSVRKFSVVR